MTEQQHQNPKAHNHDVDLYLRVVCAVEMPHLGQGLSKSLDCDMKHRQDNENTCPEAKQIVQTKANMVTGFKAEKAGTETRERFTGMGTRQDHDLNKSMKVITQL